MAFVVYISLAFFILTGSYLHLANADYKQYVSLISDVHEHYRTSSVFFIFSRSDRRMQEYSMVHLLSRTFSERDVATLIISFINLDKRLNAYRKRMSRPLIVVLLKSLSDIAEFNASVEVSNKSYPIWLVIFHNSSGKIFCDYCNNPVGNIFNLRFDTLMLVVCCDKPMLQEWWSVYENQTEFHDFGSWNVNEGLMVLGNEELNARRHNIHGTGLRVVIIPTTPMIHDYGHSVGGYLGQVLRELKNAMNFTITAMIREQGHGCYNATSKSWTGAVGVLTRGEADLAIADFTITNRRLDVIDFSYPLLVSQTQLFIKEPDGSDVQWSAYFEAFTLEIWLIIITIVMTTPFLLAMIKVHGGSSSLLSLITDNCLCVWGIFCQQGLYEFPNETPMRIAYFSIFVSALVVSAAYSASLISFLTLSSPSLPFSDLLGFAKDGSYKLIVYQQSSQYDFISSSNDSVFVRMMTLMKPLQDLPRNTNEGWTQVCEERVALYTSTVEKITMDGITCNVIGIDTGHVESLAMALPAGSQYTDVVNYHIERFKTNGIFKRLKALYYDTEVPAATTYDVVELSGVTPLISVLAGGVILASFILFCEKMYYSLKNRELFCPRKIFS